MPEKISESLKKINENNKLSEAKFVEKNIAKTQTETELQADAELLPDKTLEKAIEKSLTGCRNLILKLKQADSDKYIIAETEREIFNTISTVCDGKSYKINWLIENLNIDLKYFDPTSNDSFDAEDLNLTDDERSIYDIVKNYKRNYEERPAQEQVVLDSLKARGLRYRYGTFPKVSQSGESFEDLSIKGTSDCSGLIYALYTSKGIDIPRSSAGQYEVSDILFDTKNSQKGNIEAGQPGDFIFGKRKRSGNVHHVRLVLKNLGQGKYLVIHAPRSGERVKVVEMDLNEKSKKSDFAIGRLKNLPQNTFAQNPTIKNTGIPNNTGKGVKNID